MKLHLQTIFIIILVSIPSKAQDFDSYKQYVQSRFYPALSDLTGYLNGRGGGWPNLFRNGKMATKERIETTAYYDVVNFARKVSVPVFYTYGFNDMTCCPTSTTAVYNVLPDVEKYLWIVPEIEHWTYPEQNAARSKWVMEHLSR